MAKVEKETRIDKWLWSVRLFKTRSIAAEACKANKVLVNGTTIKPSRVLNVGDKITIKRPMLDYEYKVVGLVQNRLPAKDVHTYCTLLTSEDEIEKVRLMNTTAFVQRDRGTGRPTKKERRSIDGFMDADDDEGFDDF